MRRLFDGMLVAVAWAVAAGAPAAQLKSDGPAALPAGMAVGPYLQWPTETGMVVRWETAEPATSMVEWGETSPPLKRTAVEGKAQYHEVALKDLKPETQYFYRAVSVPDSGGTIASWIYTFRTAVKPNSPFAFVVLSDTQENPKVLNRIATMAYAQRPNFTLHCGDLVSDGLVKENWTKHFFPNTAVLNRRVPLVPAIGNHEKNADFFYQYFSLPEPEYRFKFQYGNADFFVLDSQKELGPGSEQYRWLEQELAASRATWKIVAHHKCPYSSDDDDYGNTYKGKTTWGDLDAREIVPLYEKYGVDVVWNGHIHTYERTLPLREGKVVERGGVVYLITGGSGGGLEDFAPTRSYFSAKVFRGHHYCYVVVNGGSLRMEAYDLEGRLFDWLALKK